jgi:hypothetical protein
MKSPDFAAAWRITGGDKPGSLGPDIAEYASHEATTAFASPVESLRLSVKETPQPEWEAPEHWALVDAFGADPAAKRDSTEAIQRAMDSGATTVFLPGHYKTSKTILVRGAVRRVLGISGQFNYGKHDRPDLRVEDGASPMVFIENFSSLSGGLEIATRRTVVLRSVGTHTITNAPASEGGDLFVEDVVGGDLRFRRQRVWARQLNVENQGTHVTNDGGDLWVLGYKTERGGTLLHTRGGGRSEVLGGFSYTTTAGKLAPMFVTDDSSVWAFFAEVCYTGDPFAVRVRETRDGQTRTLDREQAHTLPYSGYRGR